jgi:hypothetical protein
VDLPTFYPGTSDLTKARVFSVTPGGAGSGIDFVMMDTSVRLIATNDFGAAPASTPILIPVEVRVESGARLPVFSSGAFTLIQFTDVATRNEVRRSLTNSFIASVNTQTAAPEFRVRITNLPEGYVVKSMKYGTTDITSTTLKIPPALLPRPAITTAGGVTQAALTSAAPAGMTAPVLIVTLDKLPVTGIPGTRVTGSLQNPEGRSISMSGSPGILYSDGTFEFRGVAPGRHNIAAIGTSGASSFGASVVVGDRDVDGVKLEPIAVLPVEVKQADGEAQPVSQPPGTVLPPVSFRGRVIEEASGKPIQEGTVRLIGRNSAEAVVGPGGEFEFSGLLAGNYEVEVRIFGHSNVIQPVVVSDQPIHVDVKTLRLY